MPFILIQKLNKVRNYMVVMGIEDMNKKFYPAICRAVNTPTSKFSGSKEVRWGRAASKSPIGES